MASLRDGMGGEELSPSGLTYSGTAQFNPYFIGSITTESQVSGANVYSTADVIGESVYGDTVVSGPTIKCTNASGTNFVNAEGELQSVSIGSGTSVYGASIQAGSGALSSGSAAWKVFPTVYTGNPSVVATNLTTIDQAMFVHAGSINAGSFYIEGPTASDAFSWIAVGI